jgi:DNA-binding LacI/PurR family transcriptional regulator
MLSPALYTAEQQAAPAFYGKYERDRSHGRRFAGNGLSCAERIGPRAQLLRRRVEEAVQSLGYQPSALARGLRRDRTNMIGMVIPDVTNPFFPAVVRGAEDAAFANGYRLVFCNTDNDHAKELAHLSELRTCLPSGLIVIPISATSRARPSRISRAELP